MSDTTNVVNSGVTVGGNDDAPANAVAILDNDSIVEQAVASLAMGNAVAYTSVTGSDFDTKIRLLQAVTNSEGIGDNIGREINLTNVVVQVIDILDPNTGVMVKQPRIILLDDGDTAYHAISSSLLLSLRNIIGMAGEPETWASPIRVKFTRNKAKVGHYYSLDILGAMKIPAAKSSK